MINFLSLLEMTIRLTSRTHSKGRHNKYPLKEYIDGIWYVLRGGIPWRLLQRKGHWSTYYKKFTEWSKEGVFKLAFNILHKILKRQKYLDEAEYKDLYIDSTMVRNVLGSNGVGVNHYDRGRKGSKVSVICTRSGIPIHMKITGSHVHDSKIMMEQIPEITIKIVGSRLIGDKGYVSKVNKDVLVQKGITLIYPHKKNSQKTNTVLEKELLKSRHIIENLFSWSRNNRRLKLRYERNVSHFESFYYLGLIHIIMSKVAF